MNAMLRHAGALRSILWSPYASRASIVASQERRLARLVRHAYESVPFYRALFDRAGIAPGDIRCLADLSRLPVVTKNELVAAPPGDLLARGTNLSSLVSRRTSGSSGPVFTMARTTAEEFVSEMLQLRIRRYFGLRWSDRQAIAVMDTRTMKTVGRMHRLVQRLGIHRTAMFSPLTPPEMFIEQLAAFRPDVILGLAGPVARLASYMDDTARERIRPRHVITTGEVLTPGMRDRLARAFHAPVYDKYVCAELGHIAWECRQTGALHIADDHLIVEVVRDGVPVAPGERGELVATALNYHAMPFIRYKLADVVTRGPDQCACGQPFSTIMAVQGRMVDFLYLHDGRVMHPYELGLAVQQAGKWVKDFQLVQESTELIVGYVVPTIMPPTEEVERLLAIANATVGEGTTFRIEFVDRVDFGATGKLRPFRSHVRSEYDGIDWDAMVDVPPRRVGR